MSTLKPDSADKYSESIGSYCFIHDYKPCRGNASISNLIPDANWWLNHHGLEKSCSVDHPNVLETDAKKLAAIYVNGNAKVFSENKLIEHYCNSDPKMDAAFCLDAPTEHFCSHNKSNRESLSLKFESTINEDSFSNAHLIGLDSSNCLHFERPEKLCSDLESHWIGVKNFEPWWHAVDKDNLASLVSQTSSHCVRSCDHPGVEFMHVEKRSEVRATCFDQLEKEKKVSLVADCKQGNLALESSGKSLGKQGSMGSMQQQSDQNYRDSLNNARVDSSDTREPSGDLSRAQLLEALCHSQTRAREAEKLAQKACDDKDHVVNLFFQQAMCLFAYRQWLRLLQLETLCLHLRRKDEMVPFGTPFVLPLVRGTLRNDKCSGAVKRKLDKQRHNVKRCAIVLAVGLSLAGAGLLVGWTIGWVFPPF